MNKKTGSNKNNTIFTLLFAAILFVIIIVMIKPNNTGAVSGGDLTNSDIDPVLRQAVTYYYDNVEYEVKPDEVEAVKKSFGCHFEIHIYNKGELDMKLSYAGGRFYEN